jgi:hypothetical protein
MPRHYAHAKVQQPIPSGRDVEVAAETLAARRRLDATSRVVIMFRAVARRSSRAINMAYAQRRPGLRRR